MEELRISRANGVGDRRALDGGGRTEGGIGERAGGRGGGRRLISVAGTPVSCRRRVSFQGCDARGERGVVGGRGANAQLQGRGRRGEGRRAMASRRAHTQRMRRPNYPCGRTSFSFAWPSCARRRLGSTPRSSRHVCTRRFPISTGLLYLYVQLSYYIESAPDQHPFLSMRAKKIWK